MDVKFKQNNVKNSTKVCSSFNDFLKLKIIANFQQNLNKIMFLQNNPNHWRKYHWLLKVNIVEDYDDLWY